VLCFGEQQARATITPNALVLELLGCACGLRQNLAMRATPLPARLPLRLLVAAGRDMADKISLKQDELDLCEAEGATLWLGIAAAQQHGWQRHRASTAKGT
jgi:hypothetical protein